MVLLFTFQKPVGGVALFGGADGPSFLTESLRSTSSHGDEEGIGSPGLAKKIPSSGKKQQQGLGSGLFDDGEGEEDEGERGELFESTAR